MRYLFLIFALLTFITPVNEVEAGNTVSVNRGEAMKALSWVVANAPSCSPDTDYPNNGDGIRIRWRGLTPSASGTHAFTSPTLYVNEPISGTFEDYSFWCTAGSASDTSILRVCNNTTHRSDGGSACVPIPSYDITFDGNTSTGGSMGNQTILSGATAALTSNGFTKTGHVFAGWATTPAGAVSYANGANYIIGGANVTLYAKWTLNSCVNGANNFPTCNTCTLPLGWNGSACVTTYLVTYNGNGNNSGSAPANQNKVHDVNLNLALNSGSLARTNFFFAGWEYKGIVFVYSTHS